MITNAAKHRGSDSTHHLQLHEHRFSLFQKNSVAFAPNHQLPSDIDAIAHLPPPHVFYKTHDTLDIKRRSFSSKVNESLKLKGLHVKTGKIPIPRPYKNHWAELINRRAKRDFIYGRDEEYEFSERDSRVKTPCCGLLAFHTIELLDLTVNRQSFLDNIPVSFYCLISIGAIKRCTKIVHARDCHQIRMDSNVHLSIEVSEWREAPNNRLRLELWSFQDPEAHFIVGTVEIHIYNFIRIQHKIETVYLWSDGIKVGRLAYEVAFSYGSFGYGHSNQLKNFSQPIMETISHSMFPRIKLDDENDIADKAFQARKPEKLKLFTYHSLILEVDEKNPNISAFFGRMKERAHVDLEPKPMVVQQVEFEQGFPVHCKLHMNIWQKIMQPDFNDLYGEFICLGHKRERLEYLTNLVQGRMRDMFEKEPGPIFDQLKPKELEEIHKTDTHPGTILYPPKIPCPYSQPFKLQPDDQVFQDKFPTVRRESGYLATMFGFEKKPPAEEFLNNMDYQAFKHIRFSESKLVSVKQFKNLVLAWLETAKAVTAKAFYYVFPEVKEELQIPEISVSIASPEGSTTDIYSYFTREVKDPGSQGKVDRLVRQTTALLEISKKTQTLKQKNAQSESSSSDAEEEEL